MFPEIEGGIILSGAGSNTITVQWDSTGTGEISVCYDNGSCFGCSNLQTISINVLETGCFSYRRSVTINPSIVEGASDLTDFPVLVKVQDNTLRHIYYGGNITHYNGYDIMFTDNTDGSGMVRHQIDHYDPVTGTFFIWVKIPTLSASVNTVIYLFYSNYNVTSDLSTDMVWANDYVAVYHMGKSLNDYGPTENYGINNGTQTISGKIGIGRDFERDEKDYIEITNEPDFRFDTTMTFSFWMYIESYPTASGGQNDWMDLLIKGDNVNFRLVCNRTNNNAYYAFGNGGDGDLISNGGLITAGSWIYVAGTWDGNITTPNLRKRLFINNTRFENDPGGQDISNNFLYDTFSVLLGINQAAPDTRAFDGILDEVRISRGWRSDEWILTEYNNQNNPDAFLTLGTEVLVNSLSADGGTINVEDVSILAMEFTRAFLTGGNGSVQWQYSINNIDFYDISGETSDTLITNPLLETTYYRVFASDAGCAEASNVDSVIVEPGFIDCEYDFRKKISIDPARISGTDDLTNFPLLVKIENNPGLRSVGQGGNVEHYLGYDMVFTGEDGVSLLAHEVEEYDSVNGSITAWVNIPAVYAGDTTTLYLYYGNNSITTNPSTSAIWNNDYIGVWHMGSDLSDAAGGGNDGTNSGTTTLPAASSMIGESSNFDGTNDYISIENEANFDVADNGKLTVSAWIYADNFVGGRQEQFINKGADSWFLRKAGTTGDNPQFYQQYSGDYLQATNTDGIATGSWHYLVSTFDHAVNNAVVYIDGSSASSSKNDPGSYNISSNDLQVRFGADAGGTPPGNYFNGRLDEVRIQNAFRSSDWIKTEYENQSDPLNFIQISNEETCATDPLPGLAASDYPSVCIGQTTSITLTGYAGNIYWQESSDSITWTYMTGESNPTVEVGPISNTMYYRASVSYCCAMFSNAVRIDYLNTSPPVLSFLVDSVSCPGGNDGAIDMSVFGTATPFSILWSNGSTTEDISSLNSGWYSVIVRDNNTCRVPDSAEVVDIPDLIPPVYDANPGNLTTICDISEQVAYADYAAFVIAGGNVSDNCGVITASFIHVNDSSDGISCPETITRTYRIFDVNGNSADYLQTITINDTINPIFDAVPDSLTAICDLSEQTAYADYAEFALAGGSASDNCKIDTASFTLASESSDGNICPEIITRTYQIADSCGNTVDFMQTITINDTVNPIFNAVPDSLTAMCDISEQTAYADYAEFALAGGSASDNCGIVETSFTFISDVSDGNRCPEIITRTYQITDSCGNTIDYIQTITINDTVNPLFDAVPGNLTAICDISEQVAYVDYAEFATAGGSASDNCNIDTVSFTLLSESSDGNSCPEIVTRTYQITDSCGNTVDYVQTITINDTVIPLFSLSAGGSFECMSDVPVPYANFAAMISDGGSASDSCGISSFTLFNEAVDTVGTVITITRTYQISDLCGNMANDDQIITIEDITPPLLTCPANHTQCADDASGAAVTGIALASYSDNCSLPGDLTISYTISGVTNTSGTDDASGTTFNIGTSNIEYTVTDESGNYDTCSFNVDILSLPVTSEITGDTSITCLANGEIYSVTSSPGSKFHWTVPTGAGITTDTSGINDYSITVNFGTVSGDITVFETNSDGCSGEIKTLAIELLGCDLIADFSSDNNTACQMDTIVFSNTSTGTSGSTTYTWDFGTDAVPASDTGAGPHEIYYTSEGVKSITLTVTEGASNTISKDISILAIPGIMLTGENRCGSGEIIFEATPSNGNLVEFSYDAGISIEESISSSPYNHSANINGNDSIEAWARAVNNTYSCYGEWSAGIELIAYPVPVTGDIIVESTGATPPANHIDIACSSESKTYSVNLVSGSTYNWNIPDLSIDNEIAESIVANWNLSEGSYSISLQEISDKGCEGSISSEQVYVSDPQVDLGIDQQICEGENYTFSAQHGFSSYLWHDNSNGSEYTSSETESVWLRVSDEFDCIARDTVELIVNPLPILVLGNDTSICDEEGYELYPGEYFTYLWTVGNNITNTSSIIVYPGTGMVSLIVTNIDNCESEDAIEILECDPSQLFGEISNVFTPNGDGVHDTWVINNIDIYPNTSIDIFDRTGRLIYHVDGGYNNDWDGTFKGKALPMDTYYYIIDFKSDKIAPGKGTVTIIID